MHRAESNNKHTKDHKECNDASIVPGVFAATPLESEQQADDRGKEEERAEQVQLSHLFLERLGAQDGLGTLEPKQDKEESDPSNWQVDVETPAPSEMVSESTSHKRTSDVGNSEHGSHKTDVHRALFQRNTLGDDEKRPSDQTRGAQSCNGSTDDQPDGSRSCRTNQRAELEDKQRRQVNPLNRVEGVEFPEDQSHRAGRQEVRTTVPTDILDGVEVIRNSGNGSGDDRVILFQS